MADTIGSNIRVAGNMLLHSFRTAAPYWAAIPMRPAGFPPPTGGALAGSAACCMPSSKPSTSI